MPVTFNGNVVAYWKQYGHEVEEGSKASSKPNKSS
jgi:hypothetical protein